MQKMSLSKGIFLQQIYNISFHNKYMLFSVDSVLTKVLFSQYSILNLVKYLEFVLV